MASASRIVWIVFRSLLAHRTMLQIVYTGPSRRDIQSESVETVETK